MLVLPVRLLLTFLHMTYVNGLIYLLDEKVIFVIVVVAWLIAVTEVSAFMRKRRFDPVRICT